MLLKLVLTPSFSSPILEENSVGVRNDTFTCTATSSQLLNPKIQVNKSNSFNNFAFKTVSWFFKALTLFFYSMFSFKLRNKIGRFGILVLIVKPYPEDIPIESIYTMTMYFFGHDVKSLHKTMQKDNDVVSFFDPILDKKWIFTNGVKKNIMSDIVV